MQGGGALLVEVQQPFSDWAIHQQLDLPGDKCAGAGGDEERWPLFISPYGEFTCLGAVGCQIMLREAGEIQSGCIHYNRREMCYY
jgi:hypothetical protein